MNKTETNEKILNKKSKRIITTICIILVTMILVNAMLISAIFTIKKRNNNNEYPKNNYIEIVYISTKLYSDFGVKTLIVQIIDDKGNVFDILNEEGTSYYYSNPSYTLRFYMKKEKFVNNSNVLKLYYKYDIKTTNGTNYVKSELLQLPIKIIENNQIYFPTLQNKLPDTKINNINMGIIEFEPQLNFTLELRLLRSV